MTTAPLDHPPAVAATGLTSDEVEQRRRDGAVNNYSPPASRSVGAILRANVLTRFNALLGSLLVVILVVGPLQDALFGLALLANTVIGIAQELRAKHALDRLTLVTAPRARVLRDGRWQEIAADDVVLDDTVQIGAGDEVVVDAQLIESVGLHVDESLLTGESRPVGKGPGDLVLAGSAVVAGSASGLAVAVGESSYAARLTVAARRFDLARSELRDGINRILQLITWVLVPTAALLIWSQLANSHSVADALRGSVAGTVTMVPEGLVLLTSVAFAVGALRLSRHGVLSRELAAVEGLARVDVLCIDKTGTLTTGRLTVDAVLPLLRNIDGDIDVEPALGALARLSDRPNATMRALAGRFAAPDGWSSSLVVAFDSTRKWSGADFGPQGRWVIGAPEVLAPNDASLLTDVAAKARSGARILLLARVEELSDSLLAGMRPVALVTLVDELREDAAQALAFLAEQGVAVKVLSGDHPGTVAALARRVGLAVDEPADGRSVAADHEALLAALAQTVVGRVTPEQKQAMVHALQAEGHVVAMTGDGVNDVMALKDADVGIAMGGGAAATRAVAQLVLLRDAFTAVPDIIGEGRRVIANMERVANLFVTKTVYATALAITVGVAGLPFPFLPRHLTLVSTLTIGVPAFVLALAPNNRRARPHFVARVARFAVPTGLVAAGATYLAYSEAREDTATSLTAARTLATIVLLAVGLWVLSILVRMGDDEQRWIVPVMTACFVTVLAIGPVRQFFALALPRPLVLLAGVGAAALSGLALEGGWLVAGWLRPQRRQNTAATTRKSGRSPLHLTPPDGRS